MNVLDYLKRNRGLSRKSLLSLKKLDLSGLQLITTDVKPNLLRLFRTSCISISDIDKLKELEELDVSNTRLVELGNIIHLPKLRRLNISNNSISKIYGIDQLSLLEHLTITNTNVKITTKLMEQLNKLDCTIYI